VTDALSPKQLDYLRNSTATVNVCDGSIRSGKTIITLFRWLLFVRRAPRGGAPATVFGVTLSPPCKTPNCSEPSPTPS
jgi:DNA helicase IV